MWNSILLHPLLVWCFQNSLALSVGYEEECPFRKGQMASLEIVESFARLVI